MSGQARRATDAGPEPEQLDLLDWLAAQERGEDPTSSSADPGDAALLRLTRVDPALDMRRFYGLALVRGLFGEWGVVRRWGRIGAQGRVRTDWHGTREAGEAELARMTKAKWRRGYR